MSKGNMLLGHARGKVGSLVFSRADGKQIVRSRAEVVKNPRTESQMIQRIMLNTIAQAYSQMKVIVDHSFQGVSAGQASMSVFMQRNLNRLRSQVAAMRAEGKTFAEIMEFTAIKSNVFALNPYELSKGKLPEVVPYLKQGNVSAFMELQGNTYADVISEYGLQRGDQLTFIAIQQQGNAKRSFHYARVILDPRDENGAELPLTTAFIEGGAINKPSDRNEGSFASISFQEEEISFSFADIQVPVAAVAIIVSRRANDGSWERSNASFSVQSSVQKTAYSLQACLDQLADSSLATLSDMYLNNAGTGNVGGATSGDTEYHGNATGPSDEP